MFQNEFLNALRDKNCEISQCLAIGYTNFYTAFDICCPRVDIFNPMSTFTTLTITPLPLKLFVFLETPWVLSAYSNFWMFLHMNIYLTTIRVKLCCLVILNTQICNPLSSIPAIIGASLPKPVLLGDPGAIISGLVSPENPLAIT